MNGITKRIIFGLLYIFVIVIATSINLYFFSVIFFMFLMFCTYEFNRLTKVKSILPYLINGILFFIGISVLFNYEIPPFYLGTFLVLMILLSFVIMLFSKNKNSIKILGYILISSIYIGLPFMFLSSVHEQNPNIHGAVYKINLVLSIFALIWVNDTFAFLVGSKFGKNKLFERISPKKTIEGFIGGIIFTVIAGIVLSKINVLQMQDGSLVYNYKMWTIIALIVSVFGTLGDLIESKFKREANIKDSSNLIPGHGGFLDRLDSFIFTIPFVFIYLSLIQLYVS